MSMLLAPPHEVTAEHVSREDLRLPFFCTYALTQPQLSLIGRAMALVATDENRGEALGDMCP